MTRIALRLYHDPGQIEVLINLQKKDGDYERTTCVLDTGLPVLFLPNSYTEIAAHRLSERGYIQAKQAGVAHQIFNVLEAYTTIYLEDLQGKMSQPFEVLTWFADIDKFLIGYSGILERGVLHLDMPQLTRYLDLL
jgi:hypothetical protein